MLATNIGTGLVVGQFGMGVVDGPDLDREPEVIPLAGSVTFTPSIPYLPNQTADPNPITIVTAPIKGILDEEGYLCTPAADGVTPMYRGIRLFATDDPDASVRNWTYSVTYRFGVVNGATPAMKAHSMALPEGTEVDLTRVVEVPSSPGVGTPQALALLAQAEAAATLAADNSTIALDVAARADAGEFKGDKGDPGPNTVPTAEFVAGEISNPASPVAGALSAAFVPRDIAAVTYAARTPLTVKLENFMRKLRLGSAPAAILVQGDSTGTDDNEWPFLTVEWLGEKFPAYTVRHRVWDDMSQGYKFPVTVQTGTAGLRRYTDPGAGSATGRLLTIADTPATSITGDLDVRVHLNLKGGGFTSRGSLAGKWGNGEASWRVAIDPGDIMVLTWSTNGSAATTVVSTAAIPVERLSVDLYTRFYLDADNGAAGHTVTFQTSLDGIAWTTLGAPVVGAGVTSVKDSTATTQFIGYNNQALSNVGHAVDFLGLRVSTGPTAAPVIDLDMGMWDGYQPDTFYDACGNLVSTNVGLGVPTGALNIDLFNASTSGKPLSYSRDAVRFGKQAVGSVDLAFISYSHNDSSWGATYRGEYADLATMLSERWPRVQVALVAQNPKKFPMTNSEIMSHMTRTSAVLDLAAEEGYLGIDAYGEITRADPTLAATVSPDGVHPTPAGSVIWAGIVIAALQ